MASRLEVTRNPSNKQVSSGRYIYIYYIHVVARKKTGLREKERNLVLETRIYGDKL